MRDVELLEQLARYRMLLAFRLLAGSGSVTRTARTLGVTQPAVTQMMTRLERTVGFSLFDENAGRHSKLLSAQGRALLCRTNRLLGSMEQFAAAARTGFREEPQSFVVGASSSVGLRLSHIAVERLGACHPEVALRIIPLADGEAGPLVAAGEIDVALSADRSADVGLHVARLGTLPMVVVMPGGHPLAGLSEISPRDLAGHPLALPCPRCIGRTLVDAAFIAEGIRLPKIVEGGTEATTLSFVGQGSYAAVLSGYTVIGLGGERTGGERTGGEKTGGEKTGGEGLAVRPFAPRIELPLFLSCRQGERNGALVTELCRLVAEQCA